MSKAKQVPAIRFKGYDDEWRKKDFTSIVTRLSNINSGKNIPRVEYEDIVSGQGILNKNIFRKKSLKSGIEFNKGDILFGKLRPYLKNWLLADFNGIAVGDFWVLTPNKTNDEYIYYLIQTSAYSDIANQSSGTKMPRSDWNLVSKTKFSIPLDITEQSRIGTFFSSLDQLITKHQQKHDKLTTLKKAMLEKMFPQNGTLIPEIRFKGFTENWEEKKLGEIANFRRGSFPQPYGNPEWYNGEGAMPFIQVVDVNGNLSLNNNTKQKISLMAQPSSVFVKKGKVIVTLQGSIGRVAIVQYDAYVDRTLLIFESFKQEINSYFWAYIIQNKFNIEKRMAPGGTIKTITKNALAIFLVKIPSPDEQQKIGHYFSNLDNLISLEQKQIDTLKNIKKACLEKMFV